MSWASHPAETPISTSIHTSLPRLDGARPGLPSANQPPPVRAAGAGAAGGGGDSEPLETSGAYRDRWIRRGGHGEPTFCARVARLPIRLAGPARKAR